MSGLTKWEGGKRKKKTRWDNGREKGLLNRQRRKRRKDLCLERERKKFRCWPFGLIILFSITIIHTHKHTSFILYLFLSPLVVLFFCIKGLLRVFWIYFWERKKFAYSQKGLLTYQNHKICMLKFIHISFVIHMYTWQDNEAIMNYKSLLMFHS